MRILLILAAAVVLTGAPAARAGDKPIIAPAPAWVKPMAAVAPGKSGDAAIELLLSDQQVMLEPGRESVYTASTIHIQTPQGLAVGNISLPWRPETDELTVHKLVIRRGDKLIDVLGAGGQSFTIVRREPNLESAMLDGVLTANIQPEGLQVGDILEIATTLTSRDPVMKGHVEQLGGSWNIMPIGRARLRVEWPSSLPMRVRTSGGLAAIKPVTSGGATHVELAMDGIEPLVLPDGAPARFRIGRLVELTDFNAWSDLGALMAPLYAKAADIPAGSALAGEVERIRAMSADPRRRAEASLAVVQDRIRYVALAMGEGGYVPADAATTWARRYGDCKAKTALLLALLRAFDIKAEPVAVSSTFGDGLDERLPMVGLLDHVLVRATIGGRTYWLDGTRTGDAALDRIQTPMFMWGVPLTMAGEPLVRMVPAPLDKPTEETLLHIDASGGVRAPAPARAEILMRGDDALDAKLSLANLAAEARDRALRDYWRDRLDFIEVKTAAASYDEVSGEMRLSMTGEARMEWNGSYYYTKGTGVGYRADFVRAEGPNRMAPVAVPYPFFNRVEEVIVLPPGATGIKASGRADIDETLAGIEYKRRVSQDGNRFRVVKAARSIASEIAFAAATAAQPRLRALASEPVTLQLLPSYRETEKDIAAILTRPADNVDAYLERGYTLTNIGKYDEAKAAFDAALALAPHDARALSNRGIVHVWKGDFDAAERDLAAAEEVDPRNAVIFRARGLLAQIRGQMAESVAAFDRALVLDPDNSFALSYRAEAHYALGNDEAALADSAAVLKLRPGRAELSLLRANIFRRQGKADAALAEAKALTAAAPDDPYAHVVAANIYSSFNRRDEAMRAYTRAIELKPESYIYLNRALRRPKEDRAGRRADIDAALRLDPASGEAMAAKAELLEEAGDMKGALAIYAAGIAAEPNDPGPLIARGEFHARAGRTAAAEKDFAAARPRAKGATALNNLCWARATHAVGLTAALEDCNAALREAPGAGAYLDSRALVFLRLGRLDEAIADYDKAIAKMPSSAGSLYGRGLAWKRKGDAVKAAADFAAATRANANVAKQFERYGLTP